MNLFESQSIEVQAINSRMIIPANKRKKYRSTVLNLCSQKENKNNHIFEKNGQNNRMLHT
jgi:antitoxin component of MazEF toxin-antitoxin module